MADSQATTLNNADSINSQNANQSKIGKDAVWDEERLEKAMKTLKEMHIQLRGLRTTFPRLMAPLTTKQPSPEALFQEFSQAVDTANKEVAEFRELMTDEESKEVMAQATKSRAEDLKGIKYWLESDHPDWLTREK